MSMLLGSSHHVLFYGDSITDCGRRAEKDNNNGLGNGYVAVIASALVDKYPQLKLRFTNRGISGNRIYDLENRLQSDVIDLPPNLVSIMIGINDTWRRYDRNVVSPIHEFSESYRRICRTIIEKTGASIVICEPFLLPVPDDRRAWREDLDDRITAVRDIAREFAKAFIPLDGLFAAAACQRELGYWLPDGVHPSPAGHRLIAKAWIDAICQ